MADVSWRVDAALASSSEGAGKGSKEVHLKFAVDRAPHTVGGAKEETAFVMTEEKFQIFHQELRRAKAQMSAIE